MPEPDDLPSPAGTRRPVSRRTALGLVVATGAVAGGCRPMTVARTPARRPSSTVSARPDPDVSLAATALGLERQMLDLLRASGRRHRALRAPFRAAAAVHAAHVAVLVEAVPHEDGTTGSAASAEPTSGGAAVALRPGRALAAAVRREDQLVLAQRRNAVAAQSGTFARVLAGMAAAAAQQAATLRAVSPVSAKQR